MAQLSPYLRFNGNCREAMTFYQECLGGELSVQTFAESPMASQAPAEVQNKVVHARLASDSIEILGSDMSPGPEGLIKGNDFTLSLNCGSEQEIHTLFSKLVAGGSVEHPLGVEFWGGIFGMLTDKFGVSWMMNYEQSQTA